MSHALILSFSEAGKSLEEEVGVTLLQMDSLLVGITMEVCTMMDYLNQHQLKVNG